MGADAWLHEHDAATASDGLHPGEPVYRACGEALACFVGETILPMEA